MLDTTLEVPLVSSTLTTGSEVSLIVQNVSATLTYDGGGCASAIGNIVMFTGGFTNVLVILTNTSMTTYSVVGVPVPPNWVRGDDHFVGVIPTS